MMRISRRRRGTLADISSPASSASAGRRQRWLCERLEHRAAPSDSLGILFASALAGTLGDIYLPDESAGETVIDRSITENEQFRAPESSLLPSPDLPRRGSHYRPAADPAENLATNSARDAAFLDDTPSARPLPETLPGAGDFVGHVGGGGLSTSGRPNGGLGAQFGAQSADTFAAALAARSSSESRATPHA